MNNSVQFRVRIANKKDGDDINKILSDSGWNIGTYDFSEAYPFWLVCEKNGYVVGCVQVCISKPISYLEMMAATGGLSKRERAIVFRSLFYGGCGAVKKLGALSVSAMIAHEDKSWKRILERRGSVPVNSGTRLIKSLI